jgi:segregation and condensation protein B
MDNQKLKSIIEAALLASGGSLSLDQMLQLFEEEAMPEKKALREVLAELVDDYEGRGMQITETGSGWRIQIRAEYADWVSRLWEEKPARYSRALMETLALIAYRQPITRGEIEDVRGVSVSTNIIKTLQEREWIRVVGHRDVPGKPALYATSRIFLDYFNLKSLNDLPSLAEIRDLDSINQELQLNDPDKLEEESGQAEKSAQDIEPVEVASENQQDESVEQDESDKETDSAVEQGVQ